jgi:uncharacterized protein with PIN domain
VFFEEPDAEWAVEQLEAHASERRMSTVNLAECLIRIRDRQPQPFQPSRARREGMGTISRGRGVPGRRGSRGTVERLQNRNKLL